MNQTGPGEAFFIYCDVTKEDDIKVRLETEYLDWYQFVTRQAKLCLRAFRHDKY